jgi:predicted nucleic acid-binding protein
MTTVFADSFYFFALLNARDPAHRKAVEFTSTYHGRIVTTGWVLTKLADGWARPASWRTVFRQLLTDIRANPMIAVAPCTETLLDEGIQLYTQRTDGGGIDLLVCACLTEMARTRRSVPPKVFDRA